MTYRIATVRSLLGRQEILIFRSAPVQGFVHAQFI
jgi:hypothetical protein